MAYDRYTICIMCQHFKVASLNTYFPLLINILVNLKNIQSYSRTDKRN